MKLRMALEVLFTYMYITLDLCMSYCFQVIQSLLRV